MRKAQRRKRAVRLGKSAEQVYYRCELAHDKLHRFSHNYQIGIVADIAACGAEVDYRCGF